MPCIHAYTLAGGHMKNVLFNLFLAIPVQFAADLFSGKDAPYRYFYALITTMLAGALLYTFAPQERTVLAAVPLLLLASSTDTACGEIPDLASIGITVLSFLQQTRYPYTAATVFILFTICSLFEKIGFGDVKLITAWTFMRGLRILYALPIACVLVLVIYPYNEKERRIPFAPFLSIGFLLAELLPVTL